MTPQDIEEYLNARDSMPTCSACGAAYSGNITCRTCRQTVRADNEKRGWSTEWIDRLDEIDPQFVPPAGAEEVRAFMRRLGGE